MTYRQDLPPEAIAAHDLARDVPEALWDVVVDGLLERLPPGGRCVDVGIGTGAVGGRLHDRGVQVVGVDVNASMLAVLARTRPTLPVALGDATSLPLPDGAADVVVLACLLHLVVEWRQALAEAVRVTRPGGFVAVNVGQSGMAGRTGVSRDFLRALEARVELPPMIGPATAQEPLQHLEHLGLEPLPTIEARGHARRSVADHIFRLEWNPFAWPPGVPQWALSGAAAETRITAAEHIGSIDEPREAPVVIGLAVYRRPEER